MENVKRVLFNFEPIDNLFYYFLALTRNHATKYPY